MLCERRPIPKNRGGARSDRADTCRLPAIFLPKLPFLARREVGRAPFWICDGPFWVLFWARFMRMWYSFQWQWPPLPPPPPGVPYRLVRIYAHAFDAKCNDWFVLCKVQPFYSKSSHSMDLYPYFVTSMSSNMNEHFKLTSTKCNGQISVEIIDWHIIDYNSN